MRELLDFTGRRIRLTAERWSHIQEHPEMRGQEDRIAETLREPDKENNYGHDATLV